MRCSQIAKPALDKQNNFKSVAQYSFGTRQKAAATMTRIPNRPTDGEADRQTDRGMGRGMDRLAGRQAQSIACPRPRPAQRPQRRPSRVPVPVSASLGPTTLPHPSSLFSSASASAPARPRPAAAFFSLLSFRSAQFCAQHETRYGTRACCAARGVWPQCQRQRQKQKERERGRKKGKGSASE